MAGETRSTPSLKDRELRTIFTSLIEDPREETLPTSAITQVLKKEGLHQSRIDSSIAFLDPKKTGRTSFEDFRKIKEMHDDVLERALKGVLTIPSFNVFSKELEEIFHEVAPLKGGKQATDPPILKEANPSLFGVAFCSVDAQIWSQGDAKATFTLQSLSKPIDYLMCLETRGIDLVKKFVGNEPSGRKSNAFELNDSNLPHNPLLDAGAITSCSLLLPEGRPSEKFDYANRVLNDLSGGKEIAFDNPTYLSHAENADHSFALAYFMKSFGGFEPRVDMERTLQFLFEMSSFLVTVEDVAVMAATLANGGINPVTGKRIFDPNTCRSCLSLMYSCGMYDYSGEFAYSVGLPAKSGTSGALMVVVPNVGGFCTFSPPLDENGNSLKGVAFCHKLVDRFNLHVFDTLSGLNSKKRDPRTQVTVSSQFTNIAEMCYAAANGDLLSIRSLVSAGTSVNCSDYDGRTPLHLAAAEGRLSICEFLLSKGANLNAKDRWDGTPVDEAKRGNHISIIELFAKNAK
eukprot:TRINITY_DN10130_c0_g1_i1.p1 TRINITY_DN10130_c0_g1~~TRINITY_DN10130_c0_g1_i1.p1  ORF type:complete len:565 (-),score=165.37 TRINITY_DN10130_c0_g1_i1:79-1629(-)